MATTTNYGWTTPDDTALVKDGASAIRSLGTSIDTTTKNLNPSTTLGDIEYRSSTANTNTRLGIGSTGQVLTVSGGVPAWATPSSGGMTSIASGTLSGASVSITSIPGTYIDLYLIITNRVQATANRAAAIQFNADTGTNYTTSTTYGNNAAAGVTTPDTAFIRTAGDAPTSGTVYSIETIRIPKYSDTGIYKIAVTESYQFATSASIRHSIGFWKNAAAITSIQIMAESGNLTSGNYVLYGVK